MPPTLASRLRVVPAWAWLAGLVALSAIVRYALGRRIVAPWIVVDELIYGALAESFAGGAEFAVRGEPAGGAYGVVYPLLIAPAYALFESVPDAYAAAKAVNAVVMSLAAVPAYLLARRVLPPALSLLAAALALALPSLSYTGTLMTENAFYPLFLLLALALVAFLERPGWGLLGLLAVAFVLAFLTRAQALALAPAILTAPLLLGRRGLRRFAPLYALAVAAAALVAVVQLARGRSLLGFVGAYEPVRDRDYGVGETARLFVYHVAELDLYLGVIPFAALLLLAVRSLREPFVAATAALSFWLLLAVAAFASEVPVPARVMERNAFYVAPLALIALLVWIRRGAERPRGPALAASVLAAALPVFLPFERLIGPSAVADTLALQPWWRMHDAGIGLGRLWPLAGLAAALAALAFVLVPRRLVLLLPAALLAYLVLLNYPALEGPHGMRAASVASLEAGIGSERDWIDRAVGTDAEVAFVWSGHTIPYVVWQNEFFNRSAVVVSLAGGPVAELPARPAARAEYAASDGALPLAGRPVAEDKEKGVTLYRVNGALRPIGAVRGLYRNDTWSGPHIEYVRRQCSGGSLSVLVQSDRHLLGRPQRVGEAVVQPGETRELVVRLSPEDGICRADFSISPTAVPGGNDPRRLGVRFLRFRFEPPPR